jgi:hypothetical protein
MSRSRRQCGALLVPLCGALASGQCGRRKGFADACLGGYDLDGWSVPDLTNPDDVAVVRQA